MVDDDPLPGIEHQLGHLYVLAQPETAAEETLVELLGRADVMPVMQEMLQQIARERGSAMRGFEPDIPRLVGRVPRAEGLALTSYSAEEGPGREQSLLELVIR